MLSVLTYPDGKVHIVWFSPNQLVTRSDGVGVYKPANVDEPDMDWRVFRSNLPNDILTKLCALELSPIGTTTEGVGRVSKVAGQMVFTIFLPADTGLVSLFPLPALKL